MMITVDSVLGKVEKIKYGVLFHTECEYITAIMYRAWYTSSKEPHIICCGGVPYSLQERKEVTQYEEVEQETLGTYS
jgi:hypothetical protein